jgi:hypothetical protein
MAKHEKKLIKFNNVFRNYNFKGFRAHSSKAQNKNSEANLFGYTYTCLRGGTRKTLLDKENQVKYH